MHKPYVGNKNEIFLPPQRSSKYNIYNSLPSEDKEFPLSKIKK